MTDACDLLDFALLRFERYIDDDYADGPWATWLATPAEMPDAVAGLVWSALGSPYATMRWQAAHCVRRLCEGCCEREIASLIGCMQRGGVGAFGSAQFPFYELHARLYLLIALARVAVDNVGILRPHSTAFSNAALKGFPHILIQKTAADIALFIEKIHPGTYPTEEVVKLRQVGLSLLPARVVKNYGQQVGSSGHSEIGSDSSPKLHFAWDFDHYWFNQFGPVFGVSEEQVVKYVREAATQHLNIAGNVGYPRDPRQKQWESLDHGSRGTSHSHGSYPRVDDFNFYYSYHSFLSVAARLLQEMPVLRTPNQSPGEDEWTDWLKRHSLTRSDDSVAWVMASVTYAASNLALCAKGRGVLPQENATAFS